MCLPDLALLTYLTAKLDDFKTEFQGGNKTVISRTDTVDSFNRKLKLWKTSLMKGVVTNFRSVQSRADGIARAERDGTRAETRIRLSPKRTSPFKSVGGVSSVDCWQPRCTHRL